MKKTMLWLVQSNQITPIISEFLKLLQIRTEPVLDLVFIVPDSSEDILDNITDLSPRMFKTVRRTAKNSFQGYTAKKECFGENGFSDGLLFADVLLLDDLSGGNVIHTEMVFAPPSHTCGLILQIPTPLGSSETEERIYHAAVLWARQNRIPVIGYELLPLDTRWGLAPSLPDGIVTRYPESHAHLTQTLGHRHVWLLPLYESALFSSVATQFNMTGTKAAYHYRNLHTIPAQQTVLYLPHNVAMIHEYQNLLQILQPLGKRLHLMFGFSSDQARGPYTQQEIIQTVYHQEITRFASVSYHDMTNPWEMLTADSVVACSACFQTQLAQDKNIPSIIFDPFVPPVDTGFKKRVGTAEALLNAVETVVSQATNTRAFGDIMMELTRSGA